MVAEKALIVHESFFFAEEEDPADIIATVIDAKTPDMIVRLQCAGQDQSVLISRKEWDQLVAYVATEEVAE